ncbi:MAG: riboflavin synthase [Solirubrobacteraceae bacterium]
MSSNAPVPQPAQTQMFTGLIADLGEVVACVRETQGAELQIQTPLAAELSVGDSIAVNGVCLTATAVGRADFSAQAIAETLRRTSLGALCAGSRVNLELPLRVGDRLGGHIVQGHVDGIAVVQSVQQDGFSSVITLALPEDLARHTVLKGSIALDGVSLTISALEDSSLSVSLIPETLVRTTLGAAQPGDCVNVEVDVLAKHVERLLASTLKV